MRIEINRHGVRLSITNRWFDFGFHFRTFFDTAMAIGVKNNCSDGKRVIFLDYDDIDFKTMLLPELDYLQKKYKLGDFFIFKSSQKKNGFHVICLDKLTARQWMTFLKETGCDENYKLLSIHPQRTWVLRMSAKGKSDAPIFIYRMTSQYANRLEMSFVHSNWLKYHYGVDITGLHNFDKSDSLPIVEYGTLNWRKI